MNNTLFYYSQNAADFITSTQNVSMTTIQDSFTSLLPPNAHILDLGCGSGRDSLAFLQKNFTVTALDACKEFCQATKKLTADFQEKGRIKIIQKTFSELSAFQKYEGLWACSSLLHVPKAELPVIFQKIENSLKPDGIFYCSFKKGKFEGERNGRYFSDFIEEELCTMIEEYTKLSKVRLWLTNDARPGKTEIWVNSLWRK